MTACGSNLAAILGSEKSQLWRRHHPFVLMALATKMVVIAAAALVYMFAMLRIMELYTIYTSGKAIPLVVLHLFCLLGALRFRGHWRILLLAVFYGSAKHSMDVHMVWDVPTGTSLSGHVIVVAGASSGIGLSFAHEVAQLNATVILGCRDLSKCERVKPSSARVSCLELDLADLRSVVAFAAHVRDSTQRIDTLVLNAGLLTPHGSRTAQGFEASFGVIHLAHHLLTRELWPLLQVPHPAKLPARVISHASAAYMTGAFPSLLHGDGESDLRGEGINGCVQWTEAASWPFARAAALSLANLYTDGYIPLPPGEPALCPIAGAYSRAKLCQVLFSQALQARADEAMSISMAASSRSSRSRGEDGGGGGGGGGGDGDGTVEVVVHSVPPRRRLLSVALHPGTVQSGIVWLPDWLVRPTRIGARVLLYCLLGHDFRPGSFVDEMMGAHHLLGGNGQQGKPKGAFYSPQIALYDKVTEGKAEEYRTRLWALSERLVAPYASGDGSEWP